MREEDEDENEDGNDIFDMRDAYQPCGHQLRWKSADHQEKRAEDIDQLDHCNISQTATTISFMFSVTNTIDSISTSLLNPLSLKLDSFVQHDDSASVVLCASTGFRSDYENKEDEFRKDNTPMIGTM
jgi:hypothetical protein